MKRAYRKPGALGVFTAILAGALATGIMSRSVMAHTNHQVTISAGLTGAYYDTVDDRVEPFVCVSGSSLPDSAHVDPAHHHSLVIRIGTGSSGSTTPRGGYVDIGKDGLARALKLGSRATLKWQTRYTLQPMFNCLWHTGCDGHYLRIGSSVTVTTGAKPAGTEANPDRFCRTSTPTTPTPTTPEPETPEPETPTEPEPENPTTPDPVTPDPETPDPSTPDCTYEHRLIGVPATTGGGYTSQILISSKDSKATVKLRAFQADNGAPIDVLNSEGSAVGSTTSLSPANSVKMFRLEGARGWHIVIIEHPSKAAMDNATVAMRLREPDTGVSIELAERIEQCTNTATTAE